MLGLHKGAIFLGFTNGRSRLHGNNGEARRPAQQLSCICDIYYHSRKAIRNKKDGRILSLESSSVQLVICLIFGWVCSAAGSINHNQYDSPLAIGSFPASEMTALHEFYNATNGQYWEWSEIPSAGIPWNFTDPTQQNPCVNNWQGVRCAVLPPYHVEEIRLSLLNLTGTLPATLDAFTKLLNFYVQFNRITGSIPETLGNLLQLENVYLYGNQLTGTIPASLGNLTLLKYLYLFGNQLTGTIPASLGNLYQLQQLQINSNQLRGSLPASLGNLSQLQNLVAGSNNLTGSIPETLGNLKQLVYLELYSNQLSGTIPTTLGNLSQLQFLYLSTNQLTGTIPESLGNNSQLLYFFLFENKLSGSIPESLSCLTQLQYLSMYANQLTGTIPASMSSFVQLKDIDLDNNQLSGTIPTSLGNLTQLLYFFLYDNHLTGTIPDSLSNLNKLQYLYLYANCLTGSIPPLYYTDLLDLQLQDNHLSSRIPALVNLYSLQQMQLQNNHLTGNLDGVFDPTIQFQVGTIILNRNHLTGTLPKAIFLLKLQSFVGTSNCFEGPLPIDAICSNQNMVSFVIDGMSSAATCRNKLFISSYTLQHTIGGTIPTCLFQLPNITTLHLSGNGFTGSIPGNIALSTTLTDLSLSHNTLTGSIPEEIQLKKWSNLDLSYNRLSGTLHSTFAANTSVEFVNNRLSGVIPAVFKTMTSLSILGSNTFTCSYDQSDLPLNDPDRMQYHCGSNSFDVLFYSWLGLCITVVVSILYYMHIRVMSVAFKDEVCLRSTNLYTTISTVSRLSLSCALYSIVVLLPLYSICSVHYGTQTYQYAYEVSAVYMSGIVPFALDWCFWLVFVCIFMLLVLSSLTYSHSKELSNKPHQSYSWQTPLFVLIPYLCIDLIVVVGANAAYVYVAVYRSRQLLLLVQTLLSVFKVLWNSLLLPFVLSALTARNVHCKVKYTAQVMVNVLNNIIIPCLVVAVVSPNCFYNALVAAPSVSSSVSYSFCALAGSTLNICLQYSSYPLRTSYDPPFSYNYQCSTSLITYYSPAFVSMCIVSTFVTPLAQYICLWYYRRATVDTYWYSWLGKILPKYMQRIPDPTDAVYADSKVYLNSGGLMTTLIGTLALVLTFGVMFPPLCVALTVSIFATVVVFRVHVCRFIGEAASQNIECVAVLIKNECGSVDAMQILKDSVWVLVTVSCWFYTLFLFDILGDAVGFEGAYWVLIVMPLMPLVMYIMYGIMCTYFSHNQEEKKYVTQDVVVEMRKTNDFVHNVLVVPTEAPSHTKTECVKKLSV